MADHIVRHPPPAAALAREGEGKWHMETSSGGGSPLKQMWL